MPYPLVWARWLTPALCLALAGCNSGSEAAQARITARQQAADPPRLWLAQTLDAAGSPTASLMVCADRSLRDAFRRANAEADDGEPCLMERDTVQNATLYAARCQLRGERYGLTVNTAGDPDRDFTTTFTLTRLDNSGAKTRRVTRYRAAGACPAGWGIGDQARPGERRRFNALAGTWG